MIIYINGNMISKLFLRSNAASNLVEWRWNVHPYYQHHNLGPPHHCHNKNSIMIFILVGLLIPWDTGEGFSEKITDSHTKMSLTQKKNRYRDGSNGLNIIHHVCMYTLGNKHPVDKSWCNHGQKYVFLAKTAVSPWILACPFLTPIFLVA